MRIDGRGLARLWVPQKGITLGIERAEKLARALRVHPAVLLFPQWDVAKESKRAVG